MSTRDVRAVFEVDTADHRMTVLKDDGLYRHLRFARPGSSMYGYDLITWPGYLAIVGDVEPYVFRRLTDMVEFFAAGRGTNPTYWAEKVAGTDATIWEPDADAIRVNVTDAYDELVRAGGLMFVDPIGEIWEELTDELLDEVDNAPGRAAELLDAWGNRHGLDFSDAWDWGARRLSWRFEYACHAVRAGVDRYLDSLDPWLTAQLAHAQVVGGPANDNPKVSV